ncbi:unnamed protein product [Amaranthus hypochondriacus]
MALALDRYTSPRTKSCFPQLLKERTKKEREKSMLIATKKAVEYLPDNLVIEVLSWLPVKALLRFKAVNKSWYAMISSPHFVSKHLQNYYKNNDDWRGCLLVHHYVSQGELDLVELFVDKTTGVSLANEEMDCMPLKGSSICGPCDGIYYLYNDIYCHHRALWNPALNEIRYLPELIYKPDLPPQLTYTSYEVYGFGSGVMTGDFKVVVIKGYRANVPLSVFVYSLSMNSWKYCGDLAKRYNLEDNGCYVYVSGCCYWLGSCNYTLEVIVSFNMSNDAFKEIHIPDYAKPSSMCLAIYNDSLAFLSLHDDNKNLEIWTLNKGCWSKTLNLGPFPDVRAPIGYWKDNILILQRDGDNLLLLNLEDTQELKDLGFQTLRWCLGVFAYKESLVSVQDKIELRQLGEYEAWDNQTEDKKSMKVKAMDNKTQEVDEEIYVGVAALFENVEE